MSVYGSQAVGNLGSASLRKSIGCLWQQALVAVEERIDTLNVAENLGLREGNPPGDPICSLFVPIHV